MKDAFFKTVAPPLAFGFAGAPLDRISDQREDAQAVAALRARADARFALIARDMPILPRGARRTIRCFRLSSSPRSAARASRSLLGLDARRRAGVRRAARRRRGRGNAPTQATAFSTGAC